MSFLSIYVTSAPGRVAPVHGPSRSAAPNFWVWSEAPDFDMLSRSWIGGLDIARQPNQTLEQWQDCLDMLVETEKVERALGHLAQHRG